MRKRTIKYRYILKGHEGDPSLWSGLFDTKELAEQWFSKWGEFHLRRGHELELIETTSLMD